MATFLGQTTHISLLIIVLATTTIVHASKYRTFNAYTPSLHSNLPNNYNPFRRSPVFRQPYYTQSDPTPETYYPQPDPTPTKYYPQPDPTPTTPYTGGDSDKATFLAIHNAARASVGVPPMTWDDKVAAFAEDWANQRINDCRLVHSGSEEYGENIFWGSGDYTAAFAVESWVSERKYYDVYSNSCSGGMDCGHWTQMVWRTSTRLGCARVRCSNGGVFVTCNYDPPGNYLGVRPY